MESLKLVENVYWLGIQDHDLEVFDVVNKIWNII